MLGRSAGGRQAAGKQRVYLSLHEQPQCAKLLYRSIPNLFEGCVCRDVVRWLEECRGGVVA